jgi:hypothetical protein
MPLEFSPEGYILRVDGDILEVFTSASSSSHRVPLIWLAVQVQPYVKGHLTVWVTSARDRPLYEVMQKARTPSFAARLNIRTEEEPLYRQFFTQVAQLCGRPMAP